MRIDAHQHFWRYGPLQYPWITDKLAVLKRDFLPNDLAPELYRAGFDGCIAVQARQSIEENRFLLDLADSHPMIKGVVGWVDLRSPTVENDLANFARHRKFRGVRHVVQDEPDDRFMLGDAFQTGISKLRQFNLTYDILIFPKQLPAAIQLVQKFPGQKFVLDHFAKPFIRDGTLSPWDRQIKELAQHPNVWCKVSGMVTEANWSQWKQEDFTPYLDVVFETFGEDRVMYGSDWPVCLLSSPYQKVVGIVETYCREFSPETKAKVFRKNCASFYDLPA